MTSSYIFSKATIAGLWIGNQFISKFTVPYNKLLERFPVIKKYKYLKYATIPLVIALISGVRFLLRQIIGFGTDCITSHTEISLSEKTIVMLIMGTLISIKIITKVVKGKQQEAE